MHDDLDPDDLVAFRCCRQPGEGNLALDDIAHLATLLLEEVVMVTSVGVEESLPGVDHDPAQEPGRGELVERVVDRRQGHAQARSVGLAVELLGRNVTVPPAEQQAREAEPLFRRPQAGIVKPPDEGAEPAGALHGACHRSGRGLDEVPAVLPRSGLHKGCVVRG